MTAVRRSLALSALDNYLGLVLQLASTVIIARLLTPTETGIFAVAAVFAALASTFRDFGVAEYLIQEKELDNDAIRAALSVNVAISWLMALLLFVLAPAAARFYDAPGVADVMRVQAASFLLIPFGAVTMAWFRREMNFKPIMLASLLANIVSFAVAVGMALRGHSYMSLAWSSLAGVVVTVAASVWMRPAGFPRWPGVKGIRRVVQFGKFASGVYIFGQAGKGAPEMIIGRGLDMAAVGVFSRAYGLVEIFNRLVLRAMLPVCLPYFAKDVREQGSPLRGLLTTMSYLTVIGWTFLGYIAAVSYSAIRVMYGTQWLDAVPLAQIVCAAAAFELVYYAAKEAMLSVGKARESNALQMIVQGLRIVGLLVAVPFGLVAACWGLLVATALGAVAAHLYLRAHLGLQLGQVAAAAWPSAQVAAIALVPLFAWVGWQPLDADNFLITAAAGGLYVACAWVLGLRTLRHPLWAEVVSMYAAAMHRFARKNKP